MSNKTFANLMLLIPALFLFFGMPAVLLLTDVSGGRVFGASILLLIWCYGAAETRKSCK